MEARLQAGTAAMEAGHLERAQSILLQAAKQCQCTNRKGDARHWPEYSRDCNGGMMFITRLVLKGDLDGLRDKALAVVPCSCGGKFAHCSRQVHVEVMDKLIQCMEMTRHYTDAIHVALLLIRMDYTLPVGYCRIFKVLRHLTAVTPDVVLFPSESPLKAWRAMGMGSLEPGQKMDFLPIMHAFIKHGLHNVQEPGPASQKKYLTILKQIAHKVGLLRFDPMRKFPPEVVGMIFSQLDTLELLKCLRVHKSWSNMIMGTGFLWRQVSLIQPKSPSRKTFILFLRKHSEIREFTIADTIRFGLDSEKLKTIFEHLENLESLTLMSTSARLPRLAHMPLARPEVQTWHRNIKKLYFVRIEQLTLDIVHLLLYYFASTLEEFTIVGTPPQVHMAFQNKVLPRLKLLRLDSLQEDDPEHMRSRRRELYLMPIWLCCPSLQQLRLDRYDLLWNNNAFGPGPAADDVTWKSLRVLILGEGTRSFVGNEPACLPRFPKEMRVIDMTTLDNSLYLNVFHPREALGTAPGRREVYPHWPKLHTLRCRQRLWDTNHLRNAVHPAILSGCLRVLDFGLGLRVSPAEAQDLRTYNGWITQPARDLSFTFSTLVHTLGLCDFAWSNTADCFSAFNPQPFLDWLDHFPAVRTVRVFPGSHANTGLLIAALIRRRVPTIVMAQRFAVPGASHYDISYEGILELAKEYGVDLQLVKNDYAPPTWPFEL